MPPEPPIDYKKTLIIILVLAAIAALGFGYYKFGPFFSAKPPAPSAIPGPVFTPLSEPTELYFIQGEIAQVIGKTLMVLVNKLVGQDFASSKIISEEYKVSVGNKTELLKLNPEGETQKPVKAALKDFKKGNAIKAYTDRNTVIFKEFTAVKIELLPR